MLIRWKATVQNRLLITRAPKTLAQPPVDDKTDSVGSSERELSPDTTHSTCGELLQGPSLH